MLNELMDALREFGYPVIYGNVTDAMEEIKENKWDFFVVKKNTLAKGSYGYNLKIAVAFISEDYIKEGFEIEIIEKVRKKTKLKLANNDIEFDYTRKGTSTTIVEGCIINFVKELKKDC